MKKILIILGSVLTIFLMSCDDESVDVACGDSIILDNISYSTTLSDDFNITQASINGNCLSATVQYGGGCEDVDFSFMGSTEDFPVTLPATLKMKIVLVDNDQCEALVTENLEFDLTPLQDANHNNINLILEGWNDTFNYDF